MSIFRLKKVFVNQSMTSDTVSGTAVFIGNLKSVARIHELKSSLHSLFHKALKIPITTSDISIINGTKRYAVIDVHNKQTLEFVLENISTFEDRKKIKYNFLNLVDPGVPIHVDTLKSQDEKQARDDFENAKNLKPYQKQNREFRQTLLNPDFGRVVSVKSLKSSTSGRASRTSTSTRGGKSTPSQRSVTDVATNTDLDVTIDEFLRETGKLQVDDGLANKQVSMVPLAVSSEKEDSDDSLTQVEVYKNRALLSPIMDSETEGSEYDDPPGSIIDLRKVSRSSFTEPISKKMATPRKQHHSISRSSGVSNDFFSYLDRQMMPEMSERGSQSSRSVKQKQNVSYDEEEEDGTPYYKVSPLVYQFSFRKPVNRYANLGLDCIIFHVFFCLLIFSKSTFLKNSFKNNHQSVKQFGS